MTALADRVSMGVDRASFDDLVTLVTQAPTWEKDRAQGVRVLLRGLADGKADAPEQILWRWTWRLARATRKIQDRRASAPSTLRRSGCSARSPTRADTATRRTRPSSSTAKELPIEVGAALLASAEGYTPKATRLIDAAREELGSVEEVAAALAENLPQPKLRSRSRRRRGGGKKAQGKAQDQAAAQNGRRSRRRGDRRPLAQRRRRSRL